MPEFIYQMHQARKAHGDKVILDDVTLSFYPGAKIGVVGPNGMGKSTLLKIMAGLEEVTNGEARLTPGYSVGILLQEPPLDEDKTVLENIKQAFGDIFAKVERFNAIGMEMAEPDADFDALMEEMGQLQTEIDAANGWDLDSQLSQAMDALQCPDPDETVDHLSGGERRRVALCRLLLEAPDLLLLDEPFNGLDPEGTRAMRNLIVRLNQTLGVTVVISSHVLDQLDRVATRFGVIAEGRMVREMTAEQVQAECGDSLRVRTADPARALALMEEAFPQATLRALPDGSLSVAGDYDTTAVSRFLHDADQTVLEMSPVRRDIEDYFVELMEGGTQVAARAASDEEGGARHV